jgi:hypothetical protein
MKINTALKKYTIGLAFTCGILMGSSLATANTITILDGAVPKGILTDGTTDPTLLGYLPGETPYVPPGVTDPNFAHLFNVSPSNPANEATFFDALAGFDVGPGIQVSYGPDGCSLNCAVNITTAFFSLKLGSLTAFFQNTTGFILAATYNQIGTGAGLSHLTLYGNNLPPRDITPEIPLPAAFPLLLAGLGGLTWLSRSRKRKLSA